MARTFIKHQGTKVCQEVCQGFVSNLRLNKQSGKVPHKLLAVFSMSWYKLRINATTYTILTIKFQK